MKTSKSSMASSKEQKHESKERQQSDREQGDPDKEVQEPSKEREETSNDQEETVLDQGQTSIFQRTHGVPMNVENGTAIRRALSLLASIQMSRSFVARGLPWTPTAYAPTTRNRTSAAHKAVSRSRKSSFIGPRLCNLEELSTELPHRDRALVARDPIPEESVVVGHLFPAAAKYPAFPRGPSGLPRGGVHGVILSCDGGATLAATRPAFLASRRE